MKLKLSLLTALSLIFMGLQATVHQVTVASNSFTPSSLTITAGDTVEWTNVSGSHNVNGTTSTFPSNPASFGNSVGTGWTYQFEFTVPGTYNYQCDPHASSMQGTIVVNAAPVPAVPCSQPFFSEYIEGSSNNKGFEVYNPTGGALDLGPYKVYLSVNGGTAMSEFNLSGMLASGDVYVITTDQSDPLMLAEADTALSFPSVAHYNGDDALFLMDTVTGDTLDIIGVVGTDPGSNWPVGSGATNEHTLVRQATIDHGQTDWAIGATEWDVHPQNTYTYLGTHTSNCVVPPAVPCSQPFFSEYIEGSSNNKGFEVYNPTGGALDLGPYKVYLSVNGGTSMSEFNLSGMLASGDVYVITTDQSDPLMLAEADTALSFPSVAHYNGDDALFLMDTVTGDTLDIIGVVGTDPGSNWPVGSGATNEHTLVRKLTVEQGQTDWSIGATEWDVYPQNTYTHLGSHSSNCVVPANPTVNFETGSQTVMESAGTVRVNLVVSPTSSNAETIGLQFAFGAGLDTTDGSISPMPDLSTGMLTLNIPANEDTVSFDITIIDDAVIEANETLYVDIVAVSPGLLVGTDSSYSIVVIDNDAPVPPVPAYNIADVTGVDANGEPDSLGVRVQLDGVVYTDNFRNSGLSFYLYDQTGGLNVFSFSEVNNYTVQRGDSLRLIGNIGFYNGLIQLEVDSVEVLATGQSLKQPASVSVLDESTEGEYIRMNGWRFVDTTQWTTGSGSGGFNLDITNGTDTFVMRIANTTDLYNLPIPTTGTFDVIGAGSQYDGSSPYNEGYQIFPRDTSDFIMNVSLAEVPSVNVSLFPNPAREVLHVQTDNNKQKNVEVFTVSGKPVRVLESSDSTLSVDLSGLPKGAYMVIIRMEGGMVSHKVIVE